MTNSYFFENIQVLEKAGSSLKREHVLIKDGVIKAFGRKALKNAELLGIKPQKAKNMLLAPCLVDPHSFLESPFHGKGFRRSLRGRFGFTNGGPVSIMQDEDREIPGVI